MGPDAVEALGVGVEQLAAAEPAQVQHWGADGDEAVDVGVGEHVVEAGDRVVELVLCGRMSMPSSWASRTKNARM